MRVTQRVGTVVVELTRFRAEDAERMRDVVLELPEDSAVVLDFRRVTEYQSSALLSVVEVLERLRGTVELLGVSMHQARVLEYLRGSHHGGMTLS